MIKILQIIILVFFSLLMMSASCDKGSEDCTDSNACNYNKNAAIDDNSCWYVSEDCNCNDEPGSQIDCLGICDANPDNDPPEDDMTGVCDSTVVGGCMDLLICNYDSLATHPDGKCADDLSSFGGSSAGEDCSGVCAGSAVEDDCRVCVGGPATTLGHSWRISIKATAVFSDSSRAKDSAQFGASLYALDSYNNKDLTNGECMGCYIDFPESCQLADTLCFYFPHDEWEGDLDTIFTDGYDFDRDIRYNDLHKVFGEWMSWKAEIVSQTLTPPAKIDSLLLDFSIIEGIDYCTMNVIVNFGNDREFLLEKETESSGQVDFEIGSSDNISLTFIVKNICFNEFN